MTTLRIAQVWLLAMALLSSVLAFAATTPYSFQCDPSSGIMSSPNEHKRVGYITIFQGMGSSFVPDLKVVSPYQGSSAAGARLPATPNIAQVVGVIEKFEWSGGVGDPIRIDFYVSQSNAAQMKSLMQLALKSTRVDQLGWWIADYDPVAGRWYEQAYPLGTGAIMGIVTGKENPGLNVDLAPVPLKNVTLYKVSLSVAPAANMQYALSFASSSGSRVSKAWGLMVGTLSKTPLGQ